MAPHEGGKDCIRMPRDGAIIFSDLIDKLDVLRVKCPKCGRAGRYRLVDLISRYGRNEKLFAFTDDVTANCDRNHTRSDSDPCGALCPDLPKVVCGAALELALDLRGDATLLAGGCRP
jgi:hypothetical protein